MAIPPASAGLTTTSQPGLLSATSVGPAAAGWGQSALGGLVSPAGIAGMLLSNLSSFVKTVVRQGGLLRPDPPRGLDAQAYAEYGFWKESDISLADAEGPLDAIQIQTNRQMLGLDPIPIIGSPEAAQMYGMEWTDADQAKWDAYLESLQAPPPVPVPSPPPPRVPIDTRTWTPSAAAYEDVPQGGSAMSMISTGLGMLGGIIGDVADFATGLLPIAQATAPIWGSAAPVAATILTGGTPPTTGGVSPVSYPAALPGGAPIYAPSVTPAFGLPGVDLAPPGSTPITPYTTGAAVRLPSTVTVPYTTASGRQQYATYKNMGRPVLFSGDYAACKRVRKVASKAKRRGGR